MTDVVQTWLLFLRYRLLEGTLSAEGYVASARAARHQLPALFARLGPGERAVLDGYLEKCAPYFADDAAASPSAELAFAGARQRGA